MFWITTSNVSYLRPIHFQTNSEKRDDGEHRKELTTSATNIGLAVATFLLNTGFVLQAILLCEEYLILLKRLEMHKKEHNVTEA